MRLQSLILKLQEIAAAKGDKPVVLIVNGVAHPIDDIWWEPGQLTVVDCTFAATGAVCIGDDPR